MRRVLGLLTLLLLILTFSGCDVVTGIMEPHGNATSDNALLGELSISEDGSWNYNFNKHDTEYTVSIADEVSSIMVKPKADHLFATITVNGETVDSGSNSSEIDVTNRTTTVTVVVTAWDGITQKTYTLTIIRLLSTVTSLSSFTIIDPVDVSLTNSGNRAYSAVVGTSVETVRFNVATTHPSAEIEMRLAHNGPLDLSKAIILNSGLNSFLLKITAEDGKTTEYYTAEITKLSGNPNDCKVNSLAIEKTTMAPNFNVDDHNGAGPYAFSAEISHGKLTGGEITTNLVLTTNSGIARTTITTPNGSTIYEEGGLIQHPLTQGEFSPNVDPYNITVVVASQSGANSVTYNIALTVRAGNNDATLLSGEGITLYWGANNSRTVLYPQNLGFTSFADHDPRTYGFASYKENYIAVMYATKTATVACRASDPNASSITINGELLIPDSQGKVSSVVNLSVGYITDVNIEVKAEDNSTTKNYTVRIRALNVHEFYWGIYSPINSESFKRWYAWKETYALGAVDGFLPDTTPSDNISEQYGYLEWRTTTSPTTHMKWNNYNDGNYDSTVYDGKTFYIRTDYNYNHPTNPELDGFVISEGATYADLESLGDRDGFLHGGFILQSPQGDEICEIMTHYWVDNQDKVACPYSWVEIKYLDQLQKIMYLAEAGPYTFSDPTFSWDTPWVPAGYPLVGYPVEEKDIPATWSWRMNYDNMPLPGENDPSKTPAGCPDN